MDVPYGPWFGAVLARSSSPLLVRRLVAAVAAPPSGKGLKAVADLATRAVIAATEGLNELADWNRAFIQFSKTCSAVQLEHATLRDLGRVDPADHRAYAAIARIARRGPLLAPAVLQALGCELLHAAWNSRPADGRCLDLIAAMASVDGAAQRSGDWERLAELHPLSQERIQSALDDERLSGQPRALARRLARLFRGLRKPAPFPIEQQDDAPRGAGSAEQLGKQSGESKRSRVVPTHKSRLPAKAPSFARLAAAARHLTALDHLGVPEVWHRYRLSELRRVTSQLTNDLLAVASPDVPKLAACCIAALLVNHDHRSTLKLSLRDNDDLWLSIPDRVLVAKVGSLRRKRKNRAVDPSVQPGPEANRSNLVYIAIPDCFAIYLDRQQALAPDAHSLGMLLGIGDGDAWAQRCEAYLAPLGDPAHPARPGRVSHSLGLAYLELGASPELAAALGVAPQLCADSSLDYMTFDFATARTITSCVYEALGLGPAAHTRDYGRMGSRRALTDTEVRSVWARLEASYRGASDAIHRAVNVGQIVDAYNCGSAAAYLAKTWCTAGRGQRTDRPTHVDLRAHRTFVFADDKDTEPTSARLVPRLELLNSVIAAQLELSSAAARALQRVGVPPHAIPKSLCEPRDDDPLFGRLKFRKKGSKVEWLSLTGEDVASAVTSCGCRHRNAARHTWASAVHADGPGLWAVRTLLGHGRGAATPGSLMSTWAPVDLLTDLGRRMRLVHDRWALPNFAGQSGESDRLLLPVTIDLRRLDEATLHKRPKGKPPLFRHLPRHYCSDSSVQALRLVDEIREELHDADDFGESGAVLLSLFLMDGLIDPADLRQVWDALSAASDAASELLWTRKTGQTIRMPMQPVTRLRLQWALRPKPKGTAETAGAAPVIAKGAALPVETCDGVAPAKLPAIDEAAAQIVGRLRTKFPRVHWPATTDGILEGLSWLACHWARVSVPALLLYCYDAFTKAATFSELSFRRLTEPFDPANVSEDMLKRAVSPRTSRRPLGGELKILTETVGGVARDDRDIGDDLARSQQIKALLDERFDRSDCSSFLLLLIEWLDLEFQRWEVRGSNRLQMSPLAEYLRLIVRSVGTDTSELEPAYWTEPEWDRFAKFVLDVAKPEEEGQVSTTRAPGEIAERRKAWRRLVSVLTEAERYPAAANAFRAHDAKAVATRVARSASSTYCSTEHLAAAQEVLRRLFAHDPLEANLLMVLMRAGYECMGRADECNAIRLRDVGQDFLSLFGEFFSTEKTDGSRRAPPISAEYSTLVERLVEELRSLRPPPALLFSRRDGSVGLRYGRRRQELIVLVMRAVLRDPEFIWHTFRGVGLMRRVAPDTETALRNCVCGDLPLEHAKTIMDALRGADPRHLGRVFGCSGHASQVSPGQSYLPAWPIWYAAAMRTAGDSHQIRHRLLLRLSGARYAATHRKRRERADQMDEWRLALHQGDGRRRRRHAPAACGTGGNLEMPSWLSELARSDGVDWQTRLRFAIEVVFGMKGPPRAWRSRIDEQAACEVVAALQPLPALAELHHPTPGRPNERVRQRFSVVDLLEDDRSQELLSALEAASRPAVKALDELLTDSLRAFEPELVERALSALPAKWKLELCWPRNQLDMALVSRLAHLKERLEGLQTRVHVSGGVRSRIVPARGANQTANTNLTTFARAAVRAWLCISNQ